MNKNKPIGLLLSVAAAIAVSTAGGAAPGPQRLSVRYSDLDLATPRGMATLNKRIRRAAATLCDDHTVLPLADQIAREECVTATIQDVRPQIEQALVTDRHARLAAREYRPAESR